MLGQLVYDNLPLESVVLKVTSEKRTNEKVNGTYYIAQFSYSKTQPERLTVQREFANDFLVFRQDTITATEEITLCSDYYKSSAINSWIESLTKLAAYKE